MCIFSVLKSGEYKLGGTNLISGTDCTADSQLSDGVIANLWSSCLISDCVSFTYKLCLAWICLFLRQVIVTSAEHEETTSDYQCLQTRLAIFMSIKLQKSYSKLRLRMDGFCAV